MVDNFGWEFSAEIYKTFLLCVARIIRSEGGKITSYDGDRVMGVFIGDVQSTTAVRCGLKINYAVTHVVQPALRDQYSGIEFHLKQVVGIDTSSIRAARTGVRGGNDLVWVGRAANYAAKLTELALSESSWITSDVFSKIADEVKFGGDPKQLMWKPYTWDENGKQTIHGSTWWWQI